MAEETQSEQNSQNVQNTRREAPRAAEKPAEKPQESQELSLDDEVTEQDRSSAPSRQFHGSSRGKQTKRVIEEWASDPYCE